MEQKEQVLRTIDPYMSLDKYGRTTIRNLYFDTDTYQLIRRSIEKPAYKEKLRIRSYSQASPESTVFVFIIMASIPAISMNLRFLEMLQPISG